MAVPAVRAWTTSSTSRALLVDVGLAVAFCVILVVGTIGAASGDGPFSAANVPPAAVGLLLLAGASLALRRRLTLVTLAVTALATGTYLALAYPYGPVLAAVPIAAYAASSSLPVLRSLPAVMAAVAVVGLPFALVAPGPGAWPGTGPDAFGPEAFGGWPSAVAWSSWTLAVWAVGLAVGTVRRARAQSRYEHSRELAQAERLQTAQDVHDIVGHGLAAITMQAGIALHVLDRSPERARELLESIRSSGQLSLDELRATLALFRGEDDPAALTPQAGLAQLPELLRRMDDAGVAVSLRTQGRPVPLLAAVDTAAYRIARESLTNVLRHSGSATADVLLRHDPDRLVLEVRDHGRGTAPGEPGQGMTGMRARARALGGDLVAGPAPDGGFRVAATLPLKAPG